MAVQMLLMGIYLRTYRIFRHLIVQTNIYCPAAIRERKEVHMQKYESVCHKFHVEEGRYRKYHCKKDYAKCVILRLKMKSILCSHALR